MIVSGKSVNMREIVSDSACVFVRVCECVCVCV